jgi:hypothetical protein
MLTDTDKAELTSYLEDLYNAELFMKQENQLYYTVTIHSLKGYGQEVMLRSDFIKQAITGQIDDTNYKKSRMED